MKGKTIAIVNQKGGVGKTTTTFNLGAALTNAGKKVLLIDMDQQGNLTYCMGNDVPDLLKNTIAQVMLNVINDEEFDIQDYIMTAKNGIDYISCNVYMSSVEINLVTAMSREYVLKSILHELKNRYDYILLDCGPSFSMSTINALSAANSTLIISMAKKFSSVGLEQLVKNILRVKKKLNPGLDVEGILFCIVDATYNEAKETRAEVANRFGKMINIYDYAVPNLTEVDKANRSQKTIFEYSAGKSKVCAIYDRLAKEVMNHEFD